MAETFFQSTNTLALVAWITLVLLPGKKLVSGVLCAVVVPGLLALAYAAVIAWKLASNGLPPGDVMTLADFTAAAHLSCLDYISDVDWNRSATVKDWYAKVKSRPSFRTLLADQVPGFPPPQHYADLDF